MDFINKLFVIDNSEVLKFLTKRFVVSSILTYRIRYRLIHIRFHSTDYYDYYVSNNKIFLGKK